MSRVGDDLELDRFDRFLDEWSRRDFLKGMGGAMAASLFFAGGLEALLAACGPGNGGTNQNVKKGGHVTEATTSDPTIFHPIFISDTASLIPGNMLFLGLLEAGGDGNLKPALAKTVPTVASDQLTYKFDLRQDAYWSDGKQITSDDVVFTYDLMHGTKYDYKKINSRYYPDLEQYLDTVTAPDKFTVVMKTKTPYAPFLTGYAFGPLPKHVLEPVAINSPADFRKNDYLTAPTVVSGAFTFGKWDKTQQVVLNANSKYVRGRPNVDQYVIKNVGTDQAAVNQIKTGEVDIAGPPPSLWDDLATLSDKIDRVSFVASSYEYYGYNVDPNNPKRPVSGKIFGDPQTGKLVRQALYYAVDRQQLADKVYFKQAEPAYSVEYKTQWSLADKSQLPNYTHDTKKAADLLDQAGWKPGADGVRTKNGVRLSFELLTNQGNAARESTVQVLSEAWRQIGVEAKPKTVQFTEYVATSTTRDVDTYMGGIVSGGISDPDLSQIYHSRVIGKGLNRMGYSNPQVDQLLDEGVKVLDRSQRKKIYVQLQQILMDELPLAMLLWPKSLWAVSKRVQNFAVGPFNRYDRPWIKDVYVTDGK
ncbi:MAG TPA: ABC transporter substrate-binding protein [Candidatus Dormibacteraeota bacterium]